MSRSDSSGHGGEGRQQQTGSTGRAGETAGTEVCQFDYLTCSIPDIHGSPRGRVVPKHLIPRVLREGFGLFQGETFL